MEILKRKEEERRTIKSRSASPMMRNHMYPNKLHISSADSPHKSSKKFLFDPKSYSKEKDLQHLKRLLAKLQGKVNRRKFL